MELLVEVVHYSNTDELAILDDKDNPTPLTFLRYMVLPMAFRFRHFLTVCFIKN